ncbi:hypothetical protein C8R45DRAFT_1027756 [Mycena sanguinolenta]|nr:hypothetical protein C8R45DRAFT_1027756 [Mycena sanguinolenta]
MYGGEVEGDKGAAPAAGRAPVLRAVRGAMPRRDRNKKRRGLKSCFTTSMMRFSYSGAAGALRPRLPPVHPSERQDGIAVCAFAVDDARNSIFCPQPRRSGRFFAAELLPSSRKIASVPILHHLSFRRYGSAPTLRPLSMPSHILSMLDASSRFEPLQFGCGPSAHIARSAALSPLHVGAAQAAHSLGSLPVRSACHGWI